MAITKSCPGLPSAAAAFVALSACSRVMAQATDATRAIVTRKSTAEQHGTSYQTSAIVKLREASADGEDAVRFKACHHDLLHTWAAT